MNKNEIAQALPADMDAIDGAVGQAGKRRQDAGPPIDGAFFRRILGRFATGVAVATTFGRGGRPVGLTINSFTSVSLDPPLVLWCLGDSSERFSDFATAPIYGITFLDLEGQAIAEHFSRKADPAIATAFQAQSPKDVSGARAPRVSGGLGFLECAVVERIAAGDHLILIGRVEAMEDLSEAAALTYFQGRYGRLDP